MDAYAVEVYRMPGGDVERSWAVDVGGEDVHLVSTRDQRFAQTVDGNDGAPVTACRQVRRDDV